MSSETGADGRATFLAVMISFTCDLSTFRWLHRGRRVTSPLGWTASGPTPASPHQGTLNGGHQINARSAANWWSIIHTIRAATAGPEWIIRMVDLVLGLLGLTIALWWPGYER
ncbi:MAG: hypothetical protein HOQ44_17890 [Nocardia sp.]|nr:hypothetical protein [Nocardia sp.]